MKTKAAAYNLAHIIKSDPSLLSLLYVVGCFGPIQGIWSNKLLYDARFQTPDDVLHLILEVLYLFIVATAIQNIRPVKYMSEGASNPEMFIFSLAIWISYLHNILKYLEIRLWGVIGQASAKYAAVTSILQLLPSFALVTAATIYSAMVLFTSNDHDDSHAEHIRLLAEETGDYHTDSTASETITHVPIILMVVAWLLRLVIMFPMNYIRGRGSDFKMYSVPVNIDFIIHRNGEWTMLMLGKFPSQFIIF